jgi:hypothetical protein
MSWLNPAIKYKRGKALALESHEDKLARKLLKGIGLVESKYYAKHGRPEGALLDAVCELVDQHLGEYGYPDRYPYSGVQCLGPAIVNPKFVTDLIDRIETGVPDTVFCVHDKKTGVIKAFIPLRLDRDGLDTLKPPYKIEFATPEYVVASQAVEKFIGDLWISREDSRCEFEDN